MSSELLHRAATLMRERANAATVGEWRVIEDGHRGFPDPCLEISVWSDAAHRYVTEDVSAVPASLAEWQANAQHIASWHPAVALAVADWLEATARQGGVVFNYGDTGPYLTDSEKAALAVARAYLREDA